MQTSFLIAASLILGLSTAFAGPVQKDAKRKIAHSDSDKIICTSATGAYKIETEAPDVGVLEDNSRKGKVTKKGYGSFESSLEPKFVGLGSDGSGFYNFTITLGNHAGTEEFGAICYEK